MPAPIKLENPSLVPKNNHETSMPPAIIRTE